MSNPHLLHSAWRWLHALMFALVAALIVLAVARAPQSLTYLVAALFTAALVGWEWARVRQRGWSWVLFAAVFGTFAAFMVCTQDAGFLAFPLFFALTHALGGWRSVAAVGVLTVITIVGLTLHTGLAVGPLLGPIMGAGVALAVGLGFRMLIAESQARAEAIAELIDAKARATAMAREAGELAERTRLAGEIHDTVAQGLSSIQLLLHSAERRASKLADPELVNLLETARHTAATNLEETRRIIAALQPEPLAGSDLPVAMARVVSTTPMGPNVDFVIDGAPTALPAEVEAAILRITQTLLANVQQHARASGARVTLTYAADETSLDVVDNGVGFDPATIRPGSYGLAGARRRASEVGGTLVVESAPGAGTGVRVHIPRKGQQ